jgi:TP901 family phage tail tape measure protein
MSRMSLDTAIRLSAEVKGGGAIDRVKRSLQDFGKTGQTSKRDLDQLRAATFQLSRANDQTIAGIRNSINAFRGLQEQARIGSREFKRYGEEIQRLEAKLSGLDGAATKASASLGQKLAAGLAAAGVGRALQGITMQAANFDAELRKAAAIEGGTGSFGVLRKEIEAVAAVAAGTPTEVAALATALSRAGFSADETSAALRGVVTAAEATDVAFDQMGGIVADTLRAFGLEVSRTSDVADVLVKTANTSNQTVLDLGESLKYAAPTARSLGISLEDLAGVMGVLANNGIRGSEAGTALRTGLSRMQLAAGGASEELLGLTRGNQLLTNAMRQLGAEVTNTDGSLKSMDEVFIALKRQLDAIASPAQRVELTKALFGEEAGGKLRALLNSTEADITKFFTGVRNAKGAAEETRKAMDSFDLSVKRLDGNIQNLTNQIGGMIGAALKPLIDGLNAAIGASQKLPEPIKQFGAAAAAAGLAVGGVVVGLAALKGGLAIVGGVTALKGALLSAAGAAKVLAASLLLNPWVAAAAGVVALTAAAYKMNEPFREFVDSYPNRFNTFFRELGSDASNVMQRIQNLADNIGKFVNGVISRIRKAAGDAVQFIIARAGVLGPAIQTIAEGMGSVFSSAFTFIQNRWKDTVANMINASSPLLWILKAAGIDVGGAYAAAVSGDGAQSRTPSSWQDSMFGGRAPQAPAGAVAIPQVPFIPTGTGAGTAAGSGGSGGGGGGGRSGGGGQPSIEDRIAARPFGRMIIAAARANNIDPALFAALVEQESGNRQSAISRSGAIGLAQLMPGTARELGVDPNDPMQNLMGGARYLRQQMDRFGLEGGLRAYNQGPGAQQRTPGGNSQESREYPGRVLGRYRQLVGGDANIEAMQAEGFQAQQQLQEQQEQQLDTSKRIRQEVEMTAIAMRAMNPLQRSIVEAENEAIKILQKYSDLKAKALSDGERENLAAAQKLEIESNALKLSEQLNNESKGLTSELEKIAKEAGDRLAFEREYAVLLKSGMNPELARQYLELDKIVDATRINLESRIRILEASALQLSAESEVRKEIEKQVALLNEKRKAIDGIAKDAKKNIESTTIKSEEQKIEGQIQKLKDEIKEMTSLSGQAMFAAKSIGDAFASSFRSIVDGTKSTKAALSDFFKSISERYLEMAVDIIAKQVQMIILQTILNAIGGAVSGGASSGSAATPGSPSTGIFAVPELKAPRAMGGPVNPGEIRPVGERGPELFVPYQAGTIIPAEATEALAAINSAAQGRLMVPYMGGGSGAAVSGQRGTSGLSVPFQGNGQQGGGSGLSVPFLKGADGSDGAAGMVVIDNEPIRFESTVINSVEYVTRQEAEAIGKRSEQRTLKRLQNNPSTRRAAGIR